MYNYETYRKYYMKNKKKILERQRKYSLDTKEELKKIRETKQQEKKLNEQYLYDNYFSQFRKCKVSDLLKDLENS